MARFGKLGLDNTGADQPGRVGLRVAGAVVGCFALLLALLAAVRPDLMSMATVHAVMAAMGF